MKMLLFTVRKMKSFQFSFYDVCKFSFFAKLLSLSLSLSLYDGLFLLSPFPGKDGCCLGKLMKLFILFSIISNVLLGFFSCAVVVVGHCQLFFQFKFLLVLPFFCRRDILAPFFTSFGCCIVPSYFCVYCVCFWTIFVD